MPNKKCRLDEETKRSVRNSKHGSQRLIRASHGIGQNCCGACDDANAVCVPFGCTFVCDCDDGFAYCPGCGDECGNCLPYANVEEQCFCDAQCPTSSFCNSDTHECECFPGYLFDGSTCVTDPDGPGADLNDECDGDGGSGDRAAINCINWPVLKCQVVLGTGPPPIKVCSCNGPRGYIYNETTMECDCTKTSGDQEQRRQLANPDKKRIRLQPKRATYEGAFEWYEGAIYQPESGHGYYYPETIRPLGGSSSGKRRWKSVPRNDWTVMLFLTRIGAMEICTQKRLDRYLVPRLECGHGNQYQK
ncbi:hypothetical protein MAR_028071 [Mya arenaria]|uniref:EGF-like domain-containing protein n=1 Tax=Mya arenaria TaxID=6604 RepID=A0ABY7DEE4_MYAAR|nr:hypothetical protein MAR_028071 [Mya arenaria]